MTTLAEEPLREPARQRLRMTHPSERQSQEPENHLERLGQAERPSGMLAEMPTKVLAKLPPKSSARVPTEVPKE